jgi:uncharacterized membrane protein
MSQAQKTTNNEAGPNALSQLSEDIQTSTEWQWTFIGWPWWLVLPLTIAVLWYVRRLMRQEFDTFTNGALAGWQRHSIMTARTLTALLLMLLFPQPTCSRLKTESSLPTVTILVDASESMAVTDHDRTPTQTLDEMMALGWLDEDKRSTVVRALAVHVRELQDGLPDYRNIVSTSFDRAAWQTTAENLEKWADDLPEIEPLFAEITTRVEQRTSAAREPQLNPLTPLTPQSLSVEADPTSPADPEQSSEVVLDQEPVTGQRSALSALEKLLRTREQLTETLNELIARLTDTTDAFMEQSPDTSPDSLLTVLEEQARTINELSEVAQAEVDRHLVHEAHQDDLLATFAEDRQKLQELSRLERVRQVLVQQIEPHLQQQAQLEIVRLNNDLEPENLENDIPALGLTNFSAALGALAGRQQSGPIVILSDGRQTSGSDPLPMVHGLHARGRKVGTLGVGTIETPRDAVVAEIRAADEVFLDEMMRIQVRFRLTGLTQGQWHLVISENGEEIDRRPVFAATSWQYEEFSIPATQAGLARLTAALLWQEDQLNSIDNEERGLLREVWTGVALSKLDDLVRHKHFPDRPNVSERIKTTQVPSNWGDKYAQRTRGWLIPPMTGAYSFMIAADDQAEFWLGSSADPESISLVAEVQSHVAEKDFRRSKSQQSQAIRLRAGVPYYLEMRHLEMSGGDHCQVAWILPDGSRQEMIPADYLLPWDDERLKALEELQGESDQTPDQEEARTPQEVSRDNNQQQKIITVNEDPLRVLLLDLYPRWDLRYLRTLLGRDQRVEVEARYLSVERERGSQSKFFPASLEELHGYDAIVLGDVSREELGGTQAEQQLVEFVEAQGGFLIALAGPRSMPQRYALGGLADILPIFFRAEDTPTAASRGGWSISLRTEATEPPHAMTSILNDPELNHEMWLALPTLQFVAADVQLKEIAESLVDAKQGGKSVPLVAIHEVGAGRVCYIGTDETWRWRDRVGERIHQSFWLQVFRWGLTGRLRGNDARLQVGLDRSSMILGSDNRLRAWARDADGHTLNVPIHVDIIEEKANDSSNHKNEITSVNQLRRTLIPVRDAVGIQEISLAALPVGTYRMRVTADHTALSDLTEERLLIVREAVGAETIELAADFPMLARLADAGGGTFGGLHEWQSVVQSVAKDLEPVRSQTRRTFDIFRLGWLIMCLLVLLLGGEWILRKRAGLA